jgi:3-methyladenine DNA glycosylase AlkC
VRRSVANHLNDIAKDHPQLIVHWLQEHLPGAPPARRALLKHASRTLIKQGHPAGAEGLGTGHAAARRGHAGAGTEDAGGG